MEEEDNGRICSCSNCKWCEVHDCDPDDSSVCTRICRGSMHYNLINPDISIGICCEWSPDLNTYEEMTGYQGPVPYQYRYVYGRD
ncbi:MAG: hypothetical protein WCQ23_04980 [Candidatus Methanomethylophilaceae archaeon]|jgi:hypothetical protein